MYFLFYVITYVNFKLNALLNILLNKHFKNRFDVYTPFGDLSRLEKSGITCAETCWQLATPNLDRPEDTLIVASNSYQHNSLVLRLKWRPDAAIETTTLLTQLTFDLDNQRYLFEQLETYQPNRSKVHPSYITQFGYNGSQLKLSVIRPHRHYRILFRGYMTRKEADASETKHFVKFNLQVKMTSKVFDFKSDLDEGFLIKQIAEKQHLTSACSTFERTVSHDRHEHSVALLGEYSIRSDMSKPQPLAEQIYLWGFHVREFVDSNGGKPASCRFMGLLDSGQLFHLGSVDVCNTGKRYLCGYGAFGIKPPLLPLRDFYLAWNDLEKKDKFDFSVTGQTKSLKLTAIREEHRPSFYQLKLGGVKRGWAFLEINESEDTKSQQVALSRSKSDYLMALKSGKIVEPSSSTDAVEGKSLSGGPLIVGLDETLCHSASLVGAKAASLALLRARSRVAEENKFEVPNGFVLTRHAYDHLQETNPNLKIESQQLSAQIGRGELAGLNADCIALQGSFEREARFSEKLQQLLERHLQSTLGIEDLQSLDNRSFAVRSSSWGEDEDDMSAAGQLSTELDVRSLDQLRRSIIICFASKFSPTNIEYKRQHGLPLDLPMAVVVQEMVAADKAGVLFTCDPTSGDTSLLTITANYGLGESVVSAQTDPDTVRIRVKDAETHNLEVEQTQVGSKKVIINAIGLEHQQNLERSTCCLSTDESLRLARVGLEMTSYFRCARDLEWAIKDNRLYLLQSRPVTGLEVFTEFEMMHELDCPSRAEKEFATRANICEVMPYAVTPMFYSLSVRTWAVGMANLSVFDPSNYCIDYSSEFLQICQHGFFVLRGQTFFAFGDSSDAKSNLIAKSMEIGVFGHTVDNPQLNQSSREVTEPGLRKPSLLRTLSETWRERFLTDSTINKADLSNERLRKDVNSLRFAKRKGIKSAAEGLLRQLKVTMRYGIWPIAFHLTITQASSRSNVKLLLLLAKYFRDPIELQTALTKVLSATPKVLTGQIPRYINRMSGLIGKMGSEKVKEFVEMEPLEGLQFVSRDPKSNLANEFNEFMTRFGHRGYNELEVAEKVWRDEPEKVVEMLQTNTRRFLSDSNLLTDQDDKTQEPDYDGLIESLGVAFSSKDKLIMKYWLIPNCHKYCAARERTKNCLVNFTDVQRDAMRLLARELRQTNRIPDDHLFFYLTIHELEALVREPQPSLVMQAARRRRLAKALFKEPWKFDEVLVGHKFLPNHLEQSQPLDSELADAPKLFGTTANGGRAKATVCLVRNFTEIHRVKAGQILLAYSTDIAFSPIFPLVSGVITETGGLISHGAVVAREYGLPCIIGVPNVTNILKDGEEIILDADNATIVRLD